MYWFLMSLALVGGFLLLNGALSDLLPLLGRIQVFVAILFIGSGRRMLQQRLHRGGGAALILAAAIAVSVSPSSAQEAAQEGELVEAAGGQIFVEVHGNGPPTLLLHGGMVDRTMWDAQMDALGQDLSVIRFDMRGAGESPISEAYFPAEDVTAVLDHLGVERANIVGLSNGGAVAIDFALAHPDRVASLVLAEPGVMGFQFSPQVTATMMKAAGQMQARDFTGAVETLLGSGAFTYSRERNPSGFGQIRQMVTENLQSFAMFPRYRWHETNAIARLEEITAPTLLLVSEGAEEDARKIADELEARVPGIRRVTIPDAGHMMNIDNPSAFNREVRHFLAGSE